MTYAQALAELEKRGEMRVELGLDRVREHLRGVGSPHERLKVFHVAGTNGKGSVCALLDAALRAAGYKTGLYTSPHLQEPTERLKIDGKEISQADFARLFAKTVAAPLGDRLTYFEILTSMAFQWFAEQGAQAVVLETGLGGRLDATNVVPAPLACVVTSISLDHMQYLGATTVEIAKEKGAIAKKGRPLLCPPLAEGDLNAVRGEAERAGAKFALVEPFYKQGAVDWKLGRQKFTGPRGELEIGLLGEAQARNASLARAALDAAPELPVSDDAWRRGAAAARWPGRFELVRVGDRRLILDGAHNPEAAAQLAKTWAAAPWAKQPALWIFAFMRDKDVAAALAPLAAHVREAAAVRAPTPRSLESAELAELLRRRLPQAHVEQAPDVAAALDAWLSSDGPQTAVVCGSFYLVAAAARALTERSHAQAR